MQEENIQALSCQQFELITESNIKINGLSNINESLSDHYLIYRIDNLENSKHYIGQHQTKNPLDSYLGSGKIIRQAVKKEGVEKFVKTILFDFNNFEEMNEKEKELVPLSACYPYDPMSYNLIEGGHSPAIDIRIMMTPEAIKEMNRKRSESLLGHPTTNETKQKISKKNSGKNNGMYRTSIHSGKKCMLNLKTQKYEYINTELVEEFLQNGYILQGSNFGKKKKITMDNNLTFYKSHLYKGKLLMIDNKGHEVYVDKNDLFEIKKYGSIGYKFVNKRYNYLIKELTDEL